FPSVIGTSKDHQENVVSATNTIPKEYISDLWFTVLVSKHVGSVYPLADQIDSVYPLADQINSKAVVYDHLICSGFKRGYLNWKDHGEVHEAEPLGPTPFHWMYPIERDLCTLKSYVNNKACPEGSIAEGYLARESLTLCSRYLCGVETLFTRPIRNDDDDNQNEIESSNFLCPGRPLGQHFHSELPSHKRKKSAAYEIDEKSLAQAHRYVLFNVDSIIQFREEHKNIIKGKHRSRRIPQFELEKIHCEQFIDKVFYAKDPQLEGWLVVRHVKVKDAFNMGCNSDQNSLYSIPDTCDVPSLHRNEVDGDDEIDIVSTKEVVQSAESTNQGLNISFDASDEASDPSVDKSILQVRIPQHIGIHYPEWRKVPKEKKDDLWSIVKEKFSFQSDHSEKNIKEWIIIDMSTKWKCWKYELKKSSYDPTMTINEIVASQTDDRVETGQFRMLVESWFTKEKQVESDRNKINRLKSIEPHVTGTKLFARVKDEEKKGVSPSRGGMYCITRTRKDGSIVNTVAAQFLADIKAIGDSSSIDQETTNNSDWTNDDLSKVKGLERRCSIHCTGKFLVRNDKRSYDPQVDGLSSIHDNTIDKNPSSAPGTSHHQNSHFSFWYESPSELTFQRGYLNWKDHGEVHEAAPLGNRREDERIYQHDMHGLLDDLFPTLPMKGNNAHTSEGKENTSLNTEPIKNNDPRNVRLALASDGFNPFKTMNVSYSTWPVIVIPYNLPPWYVMKQPNFILSLIIPGPKAPGNKIDVYMQPLIKELKDLWGRVETFDACARENFKLKAAILSTKSDFLRYANLSRWSTKGEYACPVCAYDKTSKWLDHGRKWCYMGHQRWLEHDHCWRRDIRSFNGNEDLRRTPIPHSGDDVLNEIENIDLNNKNDFRDHVSTVLIELCDFFRRISLKDLDKNDLQFLESQVAVERLEELSDPRVTQEIKWLARGPNNFVRRYSEVLSYYGSLKEVAKLNYSGKIHVVLFKCDWVDVNKGCKREKFGITLINFSHLTHSGSDIHDDPFVFASQVDKVFYAKDPQLEGWLVIRYVKVKDAFNMGCNSDQNSLYSIPGTCDMPSLHRNEVDGDDEIDVTESMEEEEEEEEDTY
nr:hypothetical protein CTI12_AA180240 [Tanacetum cinerariifolium]